MLNPRPNSISDSSGQEESSEDSTKLSSLDTVDIDPTLAQPLNQNNLSFWEIEEERAKGCMNLKGIEILEKKKKSIING